ncbi:peptidoglycan DD-metalloendopeptidase family protein [Paenibacillus sp. strain BS8-2]
MNDILFKRKTVLLLISALLLWCSLFSFERISNANTTLQIENVKIISDSGIYHLTFQTTEQSVSEIIIAKRNDKKEMLQFISEPVNTHNYILEELAGNIEYALHITAESNNGSQSKTYYFNSNEPGQLTDLQTEVGLLNSNEPQMGISTIESNMSILANSGSESENNGTFSSADSATEGVNYDGLINPAGDLDYYKIVINSNSGGQLKVFLGSLPNNTDYDLKVYNSSQVLVASSSNAGHSDELITLNITGSGTHTYYARVEGFLNVYNAVDAYLFRWRFYPDWEWPVPGSNRVTDVFGIPRSGGRTHDGIDIGRYSTSTSTSSWDYEILATRSGEVTTVVTNTTAPCGVEVRIEHDIINGETLETKYCHLEGSPLVSVGQNVSKGHHLGWMGNTGPTSTGKHLHIASRFDGTWRDIGLYLTRPGIDVIDDYWDNHPQYQ